MDFFRFRVQMRAMFQQVVMWDLSEAKIMSLGSVSAVRQIARIMSWSLVLLKCKALLMPKVV